jgi:hypothetical protein
MSLINSFKCWDNYFKGPNFISKKLQHPETFYVK